LKIPRALAWAILGGGFLTAGLLRRFHGGTPVSPYLHPLVGSLLFLGIVLLLLIASWEHRRGAVGGRGVRLGSLLPLLLMLFVEKWASTAWYVPVFQRISDPARDPRWLDASFALFAGALLLLWCGLFRRFSPPLVPVLVKWRSPRGAVEGLVIVGAAVLASLGLLGLLGRFTGGAGTLRTSLDGSLLGWTWAGQGLLAFAEETYYRGVLLAETYRISARLGVRAAAARRWIALAATAALFATEHLRFGAQGDVGRQWLFTFSLGVLFGLMVLLRRNLWTAAFLHGWINALVLGAAPRWETANGDPRFGSGAYIGLVLALTFVGVFWRARRREPSSPLSSN